MRSPVYVSCGRCGARVLEVQWDHQDDCLYGTPRLDPVTLTQQQIVACVIAGIDLWLVHQTVTGRHVTSRRTRWWPTRPIPGHTAPAHVCGRTWDAPRLQLAPDPTTDLAECPY